MKMIELQELRQKQASFKGKRQDFTKRIKIEVNYWIEMIKEIKGEKVR